MLAVAIALSVPSAVGQVPQGGSASPAESASAKLPAYDVVSIKQNKSGSGSVDIDTNDNRYFAKNVSLKDLLENAYGIKEDLISGVTGPVASARFDVEAKIVDRDPDALKKLTGRQYGQMLLPFLVERFQLKAHTETRALPVFELWLLRMVRSSSRRRMKRAAQVPPFMATTTAVNLLRIIFRWPL